MFYYKFGIEKVNLVLKIEVFGIKSLSKSGNPAHNSQLHMSQMFTTQ